LLETVDFLYHTPLDFLPGAFLKSEEGLKKAAAKPIKKGETYGLCNNEGTS
jgi:hypothetical protein